MCRLLALNLPWQGVGPTAGAFHAAHEARYGHRLDLPVELVNLRIQAVGEANRPEVLERVKDGCDASPTSRRGVYWAGRGWGDCDIYDRTDLARDQIVQGPTVIEEYGSTVVVSPGWRARTDKFGNLILEKTNG